jgi:hypothetical protein
VEHFTYVDSVADAGRRCVEALRAADPRAKLEGPAGGHRVGDVADLLGEVIHIWTWLVRERPRPYVDGYVAPDRPSNHEERIQRLTDWTHEAVDLLRSTDPIDAVAPMGQCDTVAGVAALLSDDLLLHAADFEWAAGIPVGRAAPTLASAALERSLRDRLCHGDNSLNWTGAVLRLEATDVDATWTVEAANDSKSRDWWEARLLANDVPPAATLRGPAEALLRWAWARDTPQAGLATDGDEAVALQVQAGLTGKSLPAPRRRWWKRD